MAEKGYFSQEWSRIFFFFIPNRISNSILTFSLGKLKKKKKKFILESIRILSLTFGVVWKEGTVILIENIRTEQKKTTYNATNSQEGTEEVLFQSAQTRQVNIFGTDSLVAC